MKLKTTLIRYNFLFRLIATMCIILCVVILISLWLVTVRSANQLREQNGEFRREITAIFAQYFEQQISLMWEVACKVGYERKVVRSQIEQHPFNEIEAIKQLALYSDKLGFAAEMCVYYSGADYVMSSSAKYSLNFFLAQHVSKENPTIAGAIAAFLSDNTYNQVGIFTTFPDASLSAQRLIYIIPMYGISNKTNDYVIYVIGSQALSADFLRSFGAENSGLSVFDAEGNMLCRNDMMAKYAPLLTKIDTASRDKRNSEPISGTDYETHIHMDKATGRIYVTLVSLVSTQKMLSDATRALQWSVLLAGVLALLVGAVCVLIAYAPILGIVRRVSGNKVALTDELKRFQNGIFESNTKSDEMRAALTEQKMIFMDYALGNLLHGAPIRKEHCTFIENERRIHSFRAITVVGFRAANQAIREHIEQSAADWDVTVFVVDDPYSGNGILVMRYPSDATYIKPLVQRIFETIDAMSLVSPRMGVGNAVQDADGLHVSYVNSQSALSGESRVTWYDEMPTTGIVDNLYPEIESGKFLRALEEGDPSRARIALNELSLCINRTVRTLSHERFICYSLIAALTQLVVKTDGSAQKYETETLLSFSSVEGLISTIDAMIDPLCIGMTKKRSAVDAKLKSEVVAFVEAHFTAQNISLVQVADQFGISIYTLSKVFKDAAGIGFREYITGRRMAMAHELILTTSMSIKDVSAQVGFARADYFSQLFKHNYGCHPSDIRKNTH